MSIHRMDDSEDGLVSCTLGDSDFNITLKPEDFVKPHIYRRHHVWRVEPAEPYVNPLNFQALCFAQKLNRERWDD